MGWCDEQGFKSLVTSILKVMDETPAPEPERPQAQAVGVPLPITRDGNNLQLANPPVPQSVAAGLLAGLVINFAACTCRKHPVSVQSLCEYGTFVARSGPAQKVRSGGIRSCVLDVEMITAVHYVQCSGLRLSR